MNNADILDEFSDTLWLEDGLSRNTLESYRRDLNKFALWLQQQRNVALLQGTHADIQGFLAYLVMEQKARATSTSRAISSLKRLYQYLLRQGNVEVDPTLCQRPFGQSGTDGGPSGRRLLNLSLWWSWKSG